MNRNVSRGDAEASATVDEMWRRADAKGVDTAAIDARALGVLLGAGYGLVPHARAMATQAGVCIASEPRDATPREGDETTTVDAFMARIGEHDGAGSAAIVFTAATASSEAADPACGWDHDVVACLARAIDARDEETGSHTHRIATIARSIGEALGLPRRDLDELEQAAPLHDIGKLAIPDAILNKPGPLSPDERMAMQRHTVAGHAILDSGRSPVLTLAADIALSHHERFDGTGYPRGLPGEAIPLAARIVAVADVFDALISERPYKAAWHPEAALAYLIENSGKHFDPDCVAAFVKRPELLRLAERRPPARAVA